MTDFVKLTDLTAELDRVANDLLVLTNTREALIAQSASDMAKEDYSDDCSECGDNRCMGDCTPFDEDQFDGGERGDPSVNPNCPEYLPPRDPLADALEMKDMPHSWQQKSTLSPRSEAYRNAMVTALAGGHSVAVAITEAKLAARLVANLPKQKPPVMLTDDELLNLPEEYLTHDECDRLDELEANAAIAEEKAFNDTLPKGKLSIGFVKRGFTTPAGLRARTLAVFVDGGLEIPEDCDFGDDVGADDELVHEADVRAHEEMEARCGLHLVASEHIQDTIDARRLAKLEGNCEPEDFMTDQLGDDFDHDLEEAIVKDALEFAGDPLHNSLLDYEDSDANCPTFMTEDELSEAQDDYDRDNAAEWAAMEREQRDFEQRNAGPNTLGCNKVSPTVRAVYIPATSEGNAIRQWFDGDDEMHQFLAGGCLYSEAGGKIRDTRGNVVGVWYVAEFSTPG